jgi:hypothetical protein
MRLNQVILAPSFFGFAACTLLQQAPLEDDSFELYDGPAHGRIVGLVVDPDGQPIEDVQVFLGATGQESDTDDGGHFSIPEVEPGEGIVVHFRAEGFTHADRMLSITDWETRNLRVELQPVGRVIHFLAEEGERIREGDLEMVLPPSAFVDSQGRTVSGEIELDLTVSDIENHGLAGAPGSFRGIDRDGIERSIMSFGFFQVEARQGEELLNLAEGVTAPVRFRVSDNLSEAQEELLGDTMDLWWWNPETAIWEYTDTAMVVDSASGELEMRTELPHFSSWNFDWAYPSSCAEFEVVDGLGLPVVGVHLQLSGISYDITHYSGYEEGTTDEDGRLTLMGAPWSQGELLASMVLDGESVEQSFLIELQDTYEDPTSCPYQYRIVMPLCFVGGDLVLSSVSTWRGDGSPLPVRMSTGVGMFYEPMGIGNLCENPNQDLLPGWQITDPGDGGGGELGTGVEVENLLDPDVLTVLPAGDLIRFSDGDDLELDLTAFEIDEEGGAIYDLEYEDGAGLDLWPEDSVDLTVRVQGEPAGLPGFELPNALMLPGPVRPLDADSGAVIRCNGAASVQVTDPGDDMNTLVSVVLADGRMALGVVEPGNTIEIPEWIASELPRGEEFQFSTVRSNYAFERLPSGTYGRLQASNIATTTMRCSD